MTLDKAELSLADCFEAGQAYVALSRLRSLEGLTLLSFDPTKIKAHPAVVKYYEELSNRHHLSGQQHKLLQDDLLEKDLPPNKKARSNAESFEESFEDEMENMKDLMDEMS